jgi:hypothetical protein
MHESVKAFQRALMVEPDNIWLRDLVNKLEPHYTLDGGVDETQRAGDIFEKRRTEEYLPRLRTAQRAVGPIY